MVAFSSFGAM